MRRVLLVCLALAAITWLEFRFYPGHSYLQGETQFYIPMLERLDTPGFLSRDLVATHPTVASTIYDEVTIFLREAGKLDFRVGLEGQQALFRFAAVLGVFLFARTAGISLWMSLLLSALINLGAVLAGPAVQLNGTEPVPRAFALDLVLLAMGLLADSKPLLSGLAGGLALIYDPIMGAVFWLIVLTALVFDRGLRFLLKPKLPVLLIFALLLANLAQLQPGISTGQRLTDKLSMAAASLQQWRTPQVWVSTWAGSEIWSYLFLFVAACWAAARIWPLLNRSMRWLTLGTALIGLVSVGVSGLLLEGARLEIVPQLQPATTLVYTVIAASLLCGIAGLHALSQARYKEGALWMAVVLAIPLNAQVLELFRLKTANTMTLRDRMSSAEDTQPVGALAAWAERDTWGSSMFLFPDAGRASYPGMFRALSRRALWADWNSGLISDYSEPAGKEWWSRWRDTMEGNYSAQRLQGMLALPVDYYVLKRENQLTGVKPVFANLVFVAYDAQDLRNATAPLAAAYP